LTALLVLVPRLCTASRGKKSTKALNTYRYCNAERRWSCTDSRNV